MDISIFKKDLPLFVLSVLIWLLALNVGKFGLVVALVPLFVLPLVVEDSTPEGEKVHQYLKSVLIQLGMFIWFVLVSVFFLAIAALGVDYRKALTTASLVFLLQPIIFGFLLLLLAYWGFRRKQQAVVARTLLLGLGALSLAASINVLVHGHF